MKGSPVGKGYDLFSLCRRSAMTDPGIWMTAYHARVYLSFFCVYVTSMRVCACVWSLRINAAWIVFCRRLMERLDNMKRSSVGNGLSQCLLCGEALGLLGTASVLCFDCCKVQQHSFHYAAGLLVITVHNIFLVFWDKSRMYDWETEMSSLFVGELERVSWLV